MADEEGEQEPINQYRHCKLATSLMDALEELIDKDKLPPEIGFSVMQKVWTHCSACCCGCLTLLSARKLGTERLRACA